MKKQPKIKLSAIHLNDGTHGLPKNPRFIKDDKFKKLVESIRDFPEAMPARGIVVDEKSTVLGGNMRLRACKELGMKDIPTSWVRYLPGLTVAQKRRFIIMDNRPMGQDDMDLLANEWDIDELIGAGFDEDELTGFMDEDDELDKESDPLGEKYEIIISCKNESEQIKLLERFTKEGLKCKAFIL